ncbi:MAG: DUF3393 domain-containing protein, partial [Gammaproteobacteria bacterium]|nr:DUF3393 domain-containing protein [Gammaproteobacteria bacterium]
MQRRQFLQFLPLTPLLSLSACTPTEVRRSVDGVVAVRQGRLGEVVAAQVPSTGIAEIDTIIRGKLAQLADKIMQRWGDKVVATPKEFVKYSDAYQSRAIINFDTGLIRIETIAEKEALSLLEQAIITTLLTPDDPEKVDLLSDKPVEMKGEPFLYGLVLDHQGKAIRGQWRARQYAKELLRTAYRQDKLNGKLHHYVELMMVKNYQGGQKNKYASQVTEQSRRYRVSEALIYAVIETESSFNPYAISSAPAYGLMQIVPTTAGRDAYQLIHGTAGTPSKDYLFLPANNIR